MCFSIHILAQPLPPGRLIAYYPFNGNANDISGNQHDGDVYGAMLTTDIFGNANSAYYFDGSDTILVENHPDFDFEDFDLVTKVTISVWFKPTNTDEEFLITKTADGNTPGPYSIGLSSGLPRVLMYNNFGEVLVDLVGTSRIETGIWQHIAITFDGNQVGLYYNGQFEVTQPISGELLKSDGDIFIGYSAFDNQYFEGEMDEIYFFNFAMTSLEILDLYYTNIVTRTREIQADNEKLKNFRVFPNPIENEINIEFNLLKERSDVTLKVIDPIGRVLNIVPLKILEKGFHSFQFIKNEVLGENANSEFYYLILELDSQYIIKFIMTK